ncbi:MAG TPA: YvrJ family protein [Bacillota bacterium]|nr:YvrJ family protein [Bacillota bacterium]
MDELFKNITEFGFPILVALYLLTRMEKKIENLTISITNLNHQIEKMDK